MARPRRRHLRGRAALASEMRSFLQWLLAASIALAATGLLAVTVADDTQAEALWGIVGPLGIVTVIWAVTGPVWALFTPARRARS
ncbi:hypothetical protein [uncultured Williamsia sp.]|uniref:hypothetical protein n=1 Tax=uncultured Williamsia sp. TaxID=259311 RepID=UPI00345AE746